MMKWLLVIVTIIGLSSCAVNPERYKVTDKYGNVNCFNAGDYAVAQSMQDMTLVVNNVYQGRAPERALVYLTSSVKASAMRYCMRDITNPRLEDVLEYSSARATSLAYKSVDPAEFVQDMGRATGKLSTAYVLYYSQSLNTFTQGR